MNSDLKSVFFGSWIGVLVTLSLVEYFAYDPVLGRLSFIPFVLYMLFNWRDIRRLESIVNTPRKLMEKFPIFTKMAAIILLVEIVIFYGIIFQGGITERKLGVSELMGYLLAPFIPVLIYHQVLLYAAISKKP